MRTARSDINRFAPATAQKNINLDILGGVRVPLAPLLEQAEIIRRLDVAYGWLDRISAEHSSAALLIPQLEQAILSKAFHGELVPQDRADEPASILLDRVRASRAAAPTLRHHRRSRIDTPPRAPQEKAAMTKSRFDDDVKGQPYLASIIHRTSGSTSVDDLFTRADLPVPDFYKQLAWEVDNGHIRDDVETLEAA